MYENKWGWEGGGGGGDGEGGGGGGGGAEDPQTLKSVIIYSFDQYYQLCC